MKLSSFVSTATCCIGLSLFGISCDWSGGGDSSFNTSGGSVAINISGSYRGILNGGRAVSNTSGGAINTLILQQTGNALEVSDSNGQRYRGNVGSPLALASPDDAGFLSVGAQLANFQVSWSGTDGVAAKDISFSGVIGVVTVQDIQGESSVQTIDSAVTDSNTQNTDTIANTDDNRSTNLDSSNTAGSSLDGSTTTDVTTTLDTTQMVFDQNGNPITEGELITVTRSTTQARNNANSATTTVANQATSQNSVNQTANNANSRTSNNATTRTITNTFQIDGNNTQYRLRGSWVENGGAVGSVDAISEAAGGSIQTVTTAPAAN